MKTTWQTPEGRAFNKKILEAMKQYQAMRSEFRSDLREWNRQKGIDLVRYGKALRESLLRKREAIREDLFQLETMLQLDNRIDIEKTVDINYLYFYVTGKQTPRREWSNLKRNTEAKPRSKRRKPGVRRKR